MALYTVSPPSILNRNPIQKAVDGAGSGDVILVEEGLYSEQISLDCGKENIRLVAKGENVILDGKKLGNNATAFLLNDVRGVEIRGFLIQNYALGVVVNLGGFNRIIRNKLTKLTANGIQIEESEGNLIWRNEVNQAEDKGMSMYSSDSNWITKNYFHQNSYGVFLSLSSHNALIGNKVLNNKVDGISTADCFQRFGRNNFIFQNEITGNQGNGVISSFNGVLVDNGIINNGENGITLGLGESVATGNQIQNNRGNGVEILSHFSQVNIIQDNLILINAGQGVDLKGPTENNLVINNRISANLGNGMDLDIEADNNKIIGNYVLGNREQDIIDQGKNNSFVGNIYKKYETKDQEES